MHHKFKLSIILVYVILFKNYRKQKIMKLGNFEIKGCVALAPMAGVADRAFRELCVQYGAGFTVSEMISSKAVVMGDKKSQTLMNLNDDERPCAIQIFGNSPDIMSQSISFAEIQNPDFIDINFGCPAPKIAGNGSGSALMKNPKLIGEIVKAVSAATNLPVTAKIRIGWDNNSVNAVEVAKIIQQNGAAAITVHGRTRQQMYAPPVNTEIIKEVKESVSIPVIANGDIKDGISAAEMLRKTNCDYLMVGRGALGRPWVFSQINAYLNDGIILPEPPIPERMKVMINHIKKICEYKGEKNGIKEARKHAAWYIKGIRGAANYRQEICMLSGIEHLEEIAYKICKEN